MAKAGNGGDGRKLNKKDNQEPVDPTTAAAGAQILSYVERIENITEEIAERQDDRKEVYAEAKGNGFSAKVIKELVADRKRDQDEKDEFETLVELYKRAMEQAAEL